MRSPYEMIDQAWDAVLGGDPAAGMRIAGQAVALLGYDGAGTSPDAANGYAAATAAALELGDLELADFASELAIEIVEGFRDEPDLELQRLRFEVVLWRARAERSRGDYDGAIATLRRMGPPGSGDPPVAGDPAAYHNELGVCLKFAGKPDLALGEYRTILADVEASAGAAMIATLHHNVAGALHALGELAPALAYARSGLALRETIVPPPATSIAADRVALAAILIDRRELADATVELDLAIACYRELLGARHYETAYAMMLRSRAALEQGRVPEAVALGREALATMTVCTSHEHPDTAYARATLALALRAAGEHAAALAECTAAVRTLRRTLGPEHSRTRDACALAALLTRTEPSRGDRPSS